MAAKVENIGFYPGEILLPECDLAKWCVVACDQYTSQPEYWREVEEKTGNAPSAAQLIFPEAFLDKVDFNEKIGQINENMERYLRKNLFKAYPDALIYTERTLQNGGVRKGILGLLDLELYDYHKGSGSLIRATEGTVLERIPPRVRIREHAPLELPHVLVLIDDEKGTVIEPISAQKGDLKPLYDLDLMQGGGHLSGWLLGRAHYAIVADALRTLASPEAFARRYGLPEAPPLLYAVGDGNHSLAAAKECWERLKPFLSPGEEKDHPARYALVELNNLHDPSLEFEAIHRAVFVPDPEDLAGELRAAAAALRGKESPQRFTLLSRQGEETVAVPHPEHPLTVGTAQQLLDQCLTERPGRIDYIHGEDVLRELVRKGAVGVLLPAMEKNALFRTVIQEGALPRKTFSMGEAADKRFYLEARRIR